MFEVMLEDTLEGVQRAVQEVWTRGFLVVGDFAP